MYIRRFIDRIFYAKLERKKSYRIATIIAKAFELADIEPDPEKRIRHSRAFTFLNSDFKFDIIPAISPQNPIGLEETYDISIFDAQGFPLFGCRIDASTKPQISVYHHGDWESSFLELKRAVI